MNQNINVAYAVVQNGVILSSHDSFEEAEIRIKEEIKKDYLSIIFKRKLRKLFKKSGNVALHRYAILKIEEAKEYK